MATVPNWVAKAIIMTPSYSGLRSFVKTTGWRATKTQVIVTTDRGERRFYLDSLTEVGDRETRLVAPDNEQLIEALRQVKISSAGSLVSSTFHEQRFQDTKVTAEELARKLTALQDATARALAMLSEVL